VVHVLFFLLALVARQRHKFLVILLSLSCRHVCGIQLISIEFVDVVEDSVQVKVDGIGDEMMVLWTDCRGKGKKGQRRWSG